MLITLDIGNTRTKLGRFEGAELVENMSIATGSWSEVLDQLRSWENQGFARGIALNSSGGHQELPEYIRVLQYDDPWPIAMKYHTPETLGMDRIALASAAYLEHGANLLLITAGTCITYNVVVDGAFLGGAISPGWAMRYKAMNAFTGALPLVEYDAQSHLLGTTTRQSLNAGVDIAMPLEIDAMVAAYNQAFSLKKAIICGGDTNTLVRHLKSHIFATSNYELHALQRLDEYFQNQDINK